jgi:cyclopropane-fatty-acyl-phospholipid synthase
MKLLTRIADQPWLPDPLIRFGVRRLIQMRLAEEARRREKRRAAFLAVMQQSPVALFSDKANAQHYEVPAAFFQQVLGPHLKYSCALWNPGVENLEQAEADMLALTADRAGLADGQRILELGCGWGSLTLFMAAAYPKSRITAVSNSAPQGRFIEERCRQRGLTNVQVITADMNHFSIDQRFDRIVSVEMFEHMRNWAALLARVESWLADHGRVFVHIFSHRQFAYAYETTGSSNWMGRHFFTGGIMPADDLIYQFNDHLAVEKHWRIDGSHYHKTAEAWLKQMDDRKEKILPVLAEVYGQAQAAIWFQRWRIFFMACSELWATGNGNQWIVSHYRLKRPTR